MLVHLGNALKDATEAEQAPAIEGMPVVVVDFEGRKIGLEVEKILGTREIVIKSLSRHYREIDGLIGASILGNGKIALLSTSKPSSASTITGPGERKGLPPRRRRHRSQGRGRAPVSAFAPRGGQAGDGPQPPAASVADLTPVDAASFDGAAAPAARAAAPVEPGAGSESVAEEAKELDALAQRVINSQGTPLEMVNNTSAIQASMSLSQFTGRRSG